MNLQQTWDVNYVKTLLVKAILEHNTMYLKVLAHTYHMLWKNEEVYISRKILKTFQE